MESGTTWTTLKSFGHAVISIALDPTTVHGMYATVMDAMGGIYFIRSHQRTMRLVVSH